MDNLVALTCPNCGAATTNHNNCEYCGSLLVRFVDKRIDINQTNYSANAETFVGMEQVLEAQYKRMEEGRADVFCSIVNGFDGSPIIYTTSTHNLGNITSNYDYKTNGIAINYITGINKEQDKKFVEMDFFPLFTFADKNADGQRYYWINFGKDYKNAARILYRIIVEVFGINPNVTLEYTIWSYINYNKCIGWQEGGQNVSEKFIYECYRGGKNETLRKTFENDSSIFGLEKKKKMIGNTVLTVRIIAIIILAIPGIALALLLLIGTIVRLFR